MLLRLSVKYRILSLTVKNKQYSIQLRSKLYCKPFIAFDVAYLHNGEVYYADQKWSIG